MTVTLHPEPGRSPHYWLGPEIDADVDVELAVVPSMGPGGLLWRVPGGAWSSLASSSAWGADRLSFPLAVRPGTDVDVCPRALVGTASERVRAP